MAMSPFRNLIACAVAAGALAVPAGAPAAAPASSQMFDAINRARALRGLSALQPAPILTNSASFWARSLMQRDRFGHSLGFIYRGGVFSYRSEVLALHTSSRINVPRVMAGWLRSRAHRVVLLDPRLQYLGVGLARGRFRGRLAVMWVGRVAF